MTKKCGSLALFALAWVAATPPLAAQTIYKCVDAHGGTLISNTRVDKNCRPIVGNPDNSLPAPAKAGARPAATPSPADFPRVGDETQKARDGDRRLILTQEQASEQRSLEQARRELAEQEAARQPAERLAPYRERVAQHERNLQAIQKEISALR